MANWTKNNLSCSTTWLTLVVLDQIDSDFKDSGSIPVNKFKYWNQSASENMREIQICSLAKMIDNMFIKIHGAKYEMGGTEDKEKSINAVNAITETLLSSTKTMSELAEIIDPHYLFWKE